jgi:hypothetical protein
MPLLESMVAHPSHVFWPDALSWAGHAVLEPQLLLHHGQITDTYLLALAVHHRGRLVSLDARMTTRPVPRGERALCLIDPKV